MIEIPIIDRVNSANVHIHQGSVEDGVNPCRPDWQTNSGSIRESYDVSTAHTVGSTSRFFMGRARRSSAAVLGTKNTDAKHRLCRNRGADYRPAIRPV